MAPSPSSPSSSKSLSSTPPPSGLSPLFAAIQEQEEDEYRVDRSQGRATPSADKGVTPKHHPPTPFPRTDKICKSSPRKLSESVWSVDGDDGSVSCYKCRPHSREKITVVPLDNNGTNKFSPLLASPNGIFKSIFSSLMRKSPKSTDAMSTSREEKWKIALAELSHKLLQATRKRDEAVSESSRLKYSMAELEKKLNKLEVYCHKLKAGLDEYSNNSPYIMAVKSQNFHENDVIEHFTVAVSEARSSVRLLSRSLVMQLRHMGGKVHERVSLLLQPYDIKISSSNNSRTLLFYLEALLSKAFYEDFETVRFQKNASNFILNPEERCEVNFASFNMLHGLTWEEVLNKGTRHFSEEFSRFCDRKMSEIVAMLGWNRAWPEPLLQAFFGASKSVWLVHLLANSVHPSLPIFRVDKGVRFDSAYMDDMSGDKGAKLVPSMVRIMISPGFYVSGGVVKCKVLSRSFSSNGHYHSNMEDKGSSPSP